jgi:hypothetical protein
MALLAGVVGLALIVGILVEAFETMVLPRRVTRAFRLARLVYRATWAPYAMIARRLKHSGRRESFLSLFGPLSLLLLIGVWAAGLILGFALLQWALGSRLATPVGFRADLYLSGTTFFTLGLGDVIPRTLAARVVTVAEAGVGFGFLALVISYLPVLYQGFSRREAEISLLDARAGSPPSAAELLRRFAPHDCAHLSQFLAQAERWSAELLESHISYPFLAYFRSQHADQSWLAMLTSILDVCALVLAGIEGAPAWPARLAFAMARHAAVDLSEVLYAPPRAPERDRLPPEALAAVRDLLGAAGLQVRVDAAADRKLGQLRQMYEPYVHALAVQLLMPLPAWLPDPEEPDNWQTSAWEPSRVAHFT